MLTHARSAGSRGRAFLMPPESSAKNGLRWLRSRDVYEPTRPALPSRCVLGTATPRRSTHPLRPHGPDATPCNWASCRSQNERDKELRMPHFPRALVLNGENQNAFAASP